MKKSKLMVNIHEFFVEGSDPKRSHVLLRIAEPSNDLERDKKGYFFALAEINNANDTEIEYLQNICEEVESGYYETEDEEDKNAFELTLEYINRRGHHVTGSRHSILHCVVGVLRGNQLMFSFHGQPNVKIIYSKNDSLDIMNIIGEEENEMSEQLFSAVMEGKLNRGDFFYASTPHVADQISDEQILNAVRSRTPQQAAAYIQNILNALRNELSYGGIFFHIPKSSEPDYAPKKKIINLEKKPSPKKSANLAEEPETNYRPREWSQKEPLLNVILITLGRSLVTGITGLYRLLKIIFKAVGRALIALIIIITNKGGQRAMLLQSLGENIERKRNYIKNLPLFSKILFLLALVLAGVFAGSLTYLRIKEKIKISQEQYRQEVQAIADKKTAADSSMIYDDDEKAFNLLREAKDLIAALPEKTPSQKDKKAELAAEVEESLNILRKINTVEPEFLIDLKTIKSEANATKLALINDHLIAFGPEDSDVYRLDLLAEQVDRKSHETISGLAAASTPKEQDKIVFLTTDNGIAEYQPKSGTIVARDISVAEGANLSNLFVYSQRLYTIDTAHNQIMRHNQTQTGYDRGSPWLKDTAEDLSDAVSMSIDGDLFILKSNGKILKFVSGYQKDFNITSLDPALENPSEIWTYNNVENIYILEPVNKRIVILNKQGKMLQQYTAEQWQHPTGMLVDEGKKVIYVLDSNKIYRFGIE